MKNFKLVLLVAVFIFVLFGFGSSFVNAGTTDCVINSTLRLGSKGSDVVCLQKYLGLFADGKFGFQTQASVKSFQSSAGLFPDGVIGSRSRAALTGGGSSYPTLHPIYPSGCTSSQGFSSTTGKPCSDDSVDIPAPINDQVPRISYILPEGCTSNLGFSTTNGESCSNIRTSAKFGDLVYVYGANFPQITFGVRTYSTVDGSLVEVSATRISSSLIKFIVPSHAGRGLHSIQVRYDEGQPSNAVNLNFIGSTQQPPSDNILTIATPSPLPNAKANTYYETKLDASGIPNGFTSNHLNWSGSLPNGLYFANSNLGELISGVPTGEYIGTQYFDVTATNASIVQDHPEIKFSSNTKRFSLTIDPPKTSTCTGAGFDPRTGFRCGCSALDGFSTTNGEPCDTGPYPPGCSSHQGWSPTTGNACDGSTVYVPPTPVIYPPGCTSTLGWSVTTGNPCF